MQRISIPADSPAQAAFIMDGDYMAPHIRRGEIVPVEWALPEQGQCGLFSLDGRTLVRQYCEDSFGNMYLFVLDRSLPDMDITVPAGGQLVCLGRLLLEKTPSLPLY